MRSLQLKLGVGLLINLIFTFLVLWWVMAVILRSLSEEHVASHLVHDCESLIDSISIDNQGRLSINHDRMEPVYHRPYSGHYYQVQTANQVIYSPSLAQHPLNITLDLNTSETVRFRTIGQTGRLLLVVVSHYEKNHIPFAIAMAGELDSSVLLISTAQRHYLLVAVLLLFFLVAMQIGLLRAGFRPLSRVQKQLRELERDDREQLDTDVPPEILDLVEEVNHLLRVLQRRLQHSRNALADLAHALKTPLTVAQQIAYQQTLNNPDDVAILRAQLANMQKLMARVLKPARLADHSPRVKLDMSQEMADLVTALRRIYQERGVSILLQAPEHCTVMFDREDILELAGNLLDNACKWAHGMVLMTIEVHNGALRVRVEDDGPGVCATDYHELSTRGTRLDEAITGHGLGLSIARFICEQYGGRLLFSRSEQLGGFCAEAVLMLSLSLHKA